MQLVYVIIINVPACARMHTAILFKDVDFVGDKTNHDNNHERQKTHEYICMTMIIISNM